uniref:SET domain-containing protein n=1 Tax=Strigamia maritima TaxID=126957 RepID=T1IUE8_STRMM
MYTKSAWKDHKNECLCLKRYYPDDEDVRLTARIIYKLKLFKRKPNESEKFCDVSRRFQDLMSHSTDTMRDSGSLSLFAESLVVKSTNIFIPEEDCPSPHELSEIIRKVDINGFGIESNGKIIGTGLYLGYRNIICVPVVFISYIDTFESTKERQEKLKKRYYFDCTCIKCQDVESDLIKMSILCPNADCPHPTVIKNGSFICLNCGEVKFEKSKLSQVDKITEKCQKALVVMNELMESKRYADVYEIAKRCIKQSKTTFHLFNILYARIVEKVCQTSRFFSEWETAIEHGKQLLVSYRYHYGKYHPILARELFNLATVYFNCANCIDSQIVLREALDVISVTHSKHHPFYLECQRNLMMCQIGLKFHAT